MRNEFKIGRKTVGPNHPTYFIVDIAANHDGDLQRAIDLIHLAAEAGADAAKFQNFLAPTIVSDYGFKALGGQLSHQSKWSKSVFEVYQDASLPIEWTVPLKEACHSAGIDYFTAPYDLDLLPVLAEHVCAWKVGSGDITWIENIEAMARFGFPVLIATGASTLEDVKRAVDAAAAHTDDLVLMQCNTNYTGSDSNFEHIALNVLKTYAEAYPDILLGLSDHTHGPATVLGAVAMGARVIEKHFTDDQTRNGPDHPFSIDPAGWREMVDRTRELELALGSAEKVIMGNESETVVLQRRGIRASRALSAGTVLSDKDLVYLRPCPEDALPPYRKDELLGKSLTRDLPEGDCVRLSDVG